jgi:hypothetical protein
MTHISAAVKVLSTEFLEIHLDVQQIHTNFLRGVFICLLHSVERVQELFLALFPCYSILSQT